MASTKDQIRLLIRKIIKEEVKGIIEEEVNAILAEKFVSTIASQKQSLTEVVMPSPRQKDPAKESYSAPRPDKKALRESLLKKMGADENPIMAMIYGDDIVDQRTPVRAASNGFVAPASMPTQTANGMVVDSDDEGIDISQFARR